MNDVVGYAVKVMFNFKQTSTKVYYFLCLFRWQETAERLTAVEDFQKKQQRIRNAQEQIVLGENPIDLYRRLDPELREALGEVALPGQLTYDFDSTYVLQTLDDTERALKQPNKSDLVQQRKLQRFVSREALASISPIA